VSAWRGSCHCGAIGFDPQPEGLPAAQPMSYKGVSKGDRDTRRSGRWTQVRG
jgi:hypothetical protein